MMSKFTSVIRAMRLRTLPLSLAGILLGLLLARADGFWSWGVAVFAMLTTVALQILSNISNELGDYLSGTDVDERHGPACSLQHGDLSVSDFRRMIALAIVVCCILGILLIISSFKNPFAIEPIVLLLLGAGAIAAATHYTLGKNPYGYRGWGDLFVFLFFGLVSVLGGYYVLAHTLNFWLLLPASAIGLFSVGVLNVNNIRDMETDRRTRVTLPLRMGERNAKIYHTFLILGGLACMLVFILLRAPSLWCLSMFCATIPLYSTHLFGVWNRHGKALDPMLPFLVITTFVLAVAVGLTFA